MRRLLAAAALAALVAGSAPAAAQLRVTKRTDLAKPVKLEPGQAAILVGFRRPDKMSAGKSGILSFIRYDLETRDIAFQPKDAKKTGDTNTYYVQVKTADKKSALEHALMIVSAGDYALLGATPGPGGQVLNTFCLGAPTFRVNEGEVVYFGDVTPYINVKVLNGNGEGKSLPGIGPGSLLVGSMVKAMTAGRANAMAFSSHLEDARKALASQPALAGALKAADIRNEATYSCAGQDMTAYKVPGAPALEPTAPQEAAAAGE